MSPIFFENKFLSINFKFYAFGANKILSSFQGHKVDVENEK